MSYDMVNSHRTNNSMDLEIVLSAAISEVKYLLSSSSILSHILCFLKTDQESGEVTSSNSVSLPSFQDNDARGTTQRHSRNIDLKTDKRKRHITLQL